MDREGLRVNVVSETPFTAECNGVHSAFLQTLESLEKLGVQAQPNGSADHADIVHVHTVGPYSLIKLLGKRRRSVVSAHVVPDSFVGSFALARFWLPLARAYLSFFYSLPKAVIAVSPDVAEQLRDMRVRAPIHLIPNGVDISRFRRPPEPRGQLRAQLGIAEDAFVVMCAGQVQPRKGVETFVRLAGEMPELTFVWVGGMPFERLTADYERMQRLQREVPPNLVFAGSVPYEEMPAYYHASDVLFFPSRQETFGLTVVEAAAAGLPLVMHDLEAFRALFGDAYLAGDERSFPAILSRLRDDADFRREWSLRSSALSARYEDVRLARELLALYRGILTEDRPRRLWGHVS